MVLIKIICPTHTMKEFYKPNEEIVVDTNKDFKCDCQGYGNHTICFCVCCKCYQNLKSWTNLSAANAYWLKFCLHNENLKAITLNTEMRFFKYWEVIDQLPLRWYDRMNQFTKKSI